MSDGPQLPVPPGWTTRKVSEVAPLVSRGTAPAYVERSPVHAIGQRCVRDAFDATAARPHDPRFLKGTLRADAGDVLLNSTGTGTIGRACIFPGGGVFIVDGHVTVVRVDPAVGHPRWLLLVLTSPQGQRFLETECYSGSTNQVELSRTSLAAMALPLPPLPEQRRIAEILDAADEAIRGTEAIIAKLELEREALVQGMVPRVDGGAGAGTARPWTLEKIGNLGDVVTGTTPPSRVPGLWGQGLPFVTPSELVDNSDDLRSAERTVTNKGIAYLRLVPAGSVLVVCIGATIGKVAVTRTACATNQQINAVIPEKGHEAKYLAAALRSNVHLIHRVAGLQALPIISKSLLSSLGLPILPIEQQRHVTAVLMAADEKLHAEREYFAKLKLQKQGLMQDLLTGRVRVAA